MKWALTLKRALTGAVAEKIMCCRLRALIPANIRKKPEALLKEISLISVMAYDDGPPRSKKATSDAHHKSMKSSRKMFASEGVVLYNQTLKAMIQMAGA